MSNAAGVVKFNILNPGFTQSQSFALASGSSVENVDVCFLCCSDIEQGVIETVFSPDEVALHKILLDSLNIQLSPETKILARLCKTCISHLEQYQELLSQLANIKSLLQIAYKRGQSILSKRQKSDFTLLKNTDSYGTTFLIYQQPKESTIPQLYISDGPILDDQPENFEDLVQLTTTTVADLDPKLMFERKTDSGSYFCKQCSDNIFYTQDEIQSHLLSEHGYAVAICNICDNCFSDSNELNLHKVNCHSEVPPLVPLKKDFKCTFCDKIFKEKVLLDDHLAASHNSESSSRPFKCPHDGCSKDFTSKYTLTTHMKIHTDRPRPYKCTVCEKSFYHSQNLVQHLKLHSSTKEFICSGCNKAFSTQHNLDVHFIVHTKLKKFGCAICDKRFARKAEVRDHERTHTGEKPFSCDFCSATFAQRSNLLSHKRATHLNDKRHKCSQCNKGFKRRRLLDYHIKSAHTGERPYACDICNATFVIPEHFKKHMRIHTGKKPFTCELCKRSFSSKDNLKAHRFVHSKQKPYECMVCEMGFMRKTLLFTHMKSQDHESEHFVVNEPKIGEKGNIVIEKTVTKIELNQEEDDQK
ncbi:gastrula zinc finger protein XlCGF57.1-like [Culicoides brevitarsis]|uniref:gastrula zinc finger protein XlCGF57.1-like n=1 Tax=Culicoides brevitarsis TaxID=469753 RepID=UPI00307C3EC5